MNEILREVRERHGRRSGIRVPNHLRALILERISNGMLIRVLSLILRRWRPGVPLSFARRILSGFFDMVNHKMINGKRSLIADRVTLVVIAIDDKTFERTVVKHRQPE